MSRRLVRAVFLAHVRRSLAELTLEVLEGASDAEVADELADVADALLPLEMLPGGVLLERLDGPVLRRLAALLVPYIASARSRLEAAAARAA